jgi:hypothetical protein
MTETSSIVSPKILIRSYRYWALNALKASPFLLVFFFASEREARAYTDPGSGALIWQVLVGGLVGAMFYFRKITSWFKGRKPVPVPDPEKDSKVDRSSIGS